MIKRIFARAAVAAVLVLAWVGLAEHAHARQIKSCAYFDNQIENDVEEGFEWSDDDVYLCQRKSDSFIVLKTQGHNFEGTREQFDAYVNAYLSEKTFLFKDSIENAIGTLFTARYFGSDGLVAVWQGRHGPTRNGTWRVGKHGVCTTIDVAHEYPKKQKAAAKKNKRFSAISIKCWDLFEIFEEPVARRDGDPFNLRSGTSPHSYNSLFSSEWFYK